MSLESYFSPNRFETVGRMSIAEHGVSTMTGSFMLDDQIIREFL